MLVYSYDNSFEGLLCCLFEAYTNRRFPDTLAGRGARLPLLAGETREVLTHPERADRVFQALGRRLSPWGRQDIMQAWLSEEDGADALLFRYMRKVLDSKGPVESDLADGDVFAVTRMAKRVRNEAHHLAGFARFQKTAQGVFFSAIAPRHNVLALLLPFFADRFADQPWILYDTARREGVFRGKEGGFQEVFLDAEEAELLAGNGGRLREELLERQELLIQSLWKHYFSSVTIKERLNPRLHRRCLPQRFWSHMTEKQ